MKTIDLNTLVQYYEEGRISKKEFVHFHSLLTQQQQRPRPVKSKPQRRAAPQPQLPGNESTGFLHFLKMHHKSAITLLGTIGIFATLTIDYMNKRSASPQAPKTAIIKQTPTQATPNKVPSADLKVIANQLKKTPIWDSEMVNNFTSQWIRLPGDQKRELKQSPWFKSFARSLKRQVKFELARRTDNDDDIVAIYRERALVQLAKTLNISVQTNPSTSENRKVTKSKPQTKQKTTVKKTSSPILAKAKPKQSTKPTVKPQTNIKSKSSRKKALKSKSTLISGRDIVNVIDQYVSAFEEGNNKQLVALFADDTHLQRPLTLSGIRSQYSDLFRSTNERWVEFRSLSWEKSSNKTIGKGKFRTSLRLANSGTYKTTTTNVMIAMQKIDDVVRITDFGLNDNSIFEYGIAAEEIKLTSKPKRSKSAPKYPTRGELQDIVTQYVDSYQAGDIRRIMKLFATASWTKDQAGLAELRNDYTDLFDSTSDRQIFINNIDWKLKNNKAMGTGDLVINLQSTLDEDISTKKGKVRIIVEKSGKKPQITHLFHIVN